MSDRSTWQATWRAVAEKELRGAPFTSLTPARHDGITIEPALGPDASRDEGLADAPREHRALLVTGRVEDLPLASDADGIWWRSSEPPPADSRVILIETLGDPRTADLAVHGEGGLARQPVVALTDVHERGGSATTEVAVGVAAAIELARRRSGPPADFRFAVSVGPELFVEIAKLRALRRLTRRALSTLDVEGALWIAARTSERSLARLDVATNVVRASIATAAAMMGGADVVGALPMDAVGETHSPLAARLARNLPQVLARESSLALVDDPARGSFEIEALTDRIARDAWEVVREIERADGLVAARALVRARIDRDAEARAGAVRSRRIPLVGVSKYPLASEALTSAQLDGRDASPFEVSRAAARVPVEIVIVGARADVEARVAFVRELLEVGGLEVVGEGRGRVAVVCGPDASFAAEVPEALRALVGRGVPAFVAGKPGASEAALRAAGALGFVALGQDVTAFFAALRRASGGTP